MYKTERQQLIFMPQPGARVLLALLLASSAATGRRRGGRPIEGLDGPATWSVAKRREVDGASAAEAHERDRRRKAGLPLLPIFPTHATTCDGRPCRPGEGNLKHSMENGVDGKRRFKQVRVHCTSMHVRPLPPSLTGPTIDSR